MPKPAEPSVSVSNRLGFDYRALAGGFRPVPGGIIDVHTHVNGGGAAKVFAEVADLYGVTRTYTQTRLSEAEAVRHVLGDMARFIAIPDYMSDDLKTAMTEGYLRDLDTWANEYGARMMKHWAAPRLRDLVDEDTYERYGRMDSPWRIRLSEHAVELGMMLMVHIGDPDTWFQTMYGDASRYGTKQQQYEPLEMMIERFDVPWLAAHMGGFPEDLEFLDGLMSRHEKLVLDTSATKWQVREWSKHDRVDVLAFLEKYRGRVLFGTDIVTSEDHLKESEPVDGRPVFGLASSYAEAFDLYASRFWAMRTLLEGDYVGESPIADPDLKMVDPERYDEMSAPHMRGFSLPDDLLEVVYRGACEATVERWYDEHA
jgi:hypothetical protein